MNRGSYLPSAQFTLLVGSLLASVGHVYAAQLFTHASPPPQITATANTADNSNWEAAFDAIEAQQATSTYTTPNPDTVGSMLAAVQSSNLTDTIGRSLLVNLSSDESQGLGSDIPTQNQLVAQAASQIEQDQATTTYYSPSNLSIVQPTSQNFHTYGNAVMQALAQYPNASEQATELALDDIVEGGDNSKAAALQEIGASYQAAAQALAGVPVPQILMPLHLQMINLLMSISSTYKDMEQIGSDPVRGLEGYQAYEALMDQGANIFTQIAQELNKNGILFSKDEPGNSWSVFLSQS